MSSKKKTYISPQMKSEEIFHAGLGGKGGGTTGGSSGGGATCNGTNNGGRKASDIDPPICSTLRT